MRSVCVLAAETPSSDPIVSAASESRPSTSIPSGAPSAVSGPPIRTTTKSRKERYGPKLAGSATAARWTAERPRDARDRACRCDRLRAEPRDREAERTRRRLPLTRRGEREAERGAREGREREGGERGEGQRELVMLVGGRSVRVDDKALRPPDEPGKGLQPEGERPRDDPRGGREDDPSQPGEREPDQPAGEPTGDPAADDRRRERHAVLQQPRANDCADRNQPALREQRQSCDADHEGKADRGRREVEAACQVGRARRAEHERCERGERERRDGSG